MLKLHWEKDDLDIHLETIPVKSYGKTKYMEFQQVLFRSDKRELQGVVLEKIYQVGDENIYFF